MPILQKINSGRIIVLFVLLEFLIVVFAFLSEGASLLALAMAARFSGLLSLLLFSVIFLLHHKPQTIHLWLSEKFYLLFTIVHGIHLAELLIFMLLADIPFIPYQLAGGLAMCLFMVLMPILYHLYLSEKIQTESFRRIEFAYLYYTWLVFFMTYLPRVQGRVTNVGGSYSEHVALLGWVSTLLGYKLSSLISMKGPQRKVRD